MNKKRAMLFIAFIAIGLTLATSNYQFQFEVVEAGTWETVEHIEGIQDLNFMPAATGNDYVDAIQTQTHGTTSNMPPTDGMGYDSNTYSILQETSTIVNSYTTKTSYTGGGLPSGWYKTNGWSMSGSYAFILGHSYPDGFFYTTAFDMSSYDGTRTKFSWKNDGLEDTEAGEFKVWSYESSAWVEIFASPAGRQATWQSKTYDRAVAGTTWRAKFQAYTLTGDVESWEGFDVDNIYLQGKTINTYYRFETVYRFESIDYAYYNSKLYIDWNAASSSYIDVYGGTTTNPTTLIADHKNDDFNVDIHSTLDGSPYYIKIVDEDQTNTAASLWYLRRCYIAITNTYPTVDGDPTIAVLDDTDNLYSRYRRYEVTTYHADVDGFGNLDMAEICIFNAAETQAYLWARFYQNTHTFEEMGAQWQKDSWELDTCTYSESGDDLDVTWKFYVEWEMVDLDNVHIRSGSDDDEGTYWVTDMWTSTWDIETDLEYDTTPTITDDDAGIVDRGDLDETFHITGALSYEGSALIPPSGDVDVWVSMTVGDWGTNVGPWEDDVLGGSGELDVICYADDAVGLETYTIKVVKEGTGYGGTDLVTGTDPTDDYIADKIVIQTTVSSDAQDRLDINGNVEIRVTASLAYTTGGTVWLGSGDTVTLDDVSMSWDAGNSWFELTRSKASVGMWDYYVNSSSETGHGITGLDLNSKNVEVIWDRVEIYSITVVDTHLGIGYGTTLSYYLRYDYDNVAVNSGGTFTTDETADALGFQSGNLWQATANEAGVGAVTFNGFTTCSDSGYGLTEWTFTGSQITITWDKVRVLGIQRSDDRCNYGSNQWVQVQFDYESAAYGYVATWSTYPTIIGPNGVITLNQDIGSGWWRGSTGTYSSVARFDYNTNTLNDFIDVDSILSRSKGAYTDYTIWDRIEFYSSAVDDSRINMNSNGWTSWLVRYDYDNAVITSGLTANLNGTKLLTWNASQSRWDYHESKSSAQKIGYEVLSATETQFTLTAWIQTAGDVSIIWDRIIIITTSATDAYIDKGTESTTINVTARLEYTGDGTHWLGGSDTLYMNSTSMTWDSDHFYIIIGPYDVFGSWSFFVNSTGANEATYSITVVNLNGQSDAVATDRVKVISYSPSDAHDNIDDYIWVVATLQYESDSSQVTDGTVVINGYSFSHIGSGQWRHNRTESTVTGITYDTVVTAGNTRGITVVNQNGQNQLVIWDQIVIQTTIVDDNRTSINANVEIRVTLWLDYYDEYLGSGDTVTLDGVSMNWDAGNSWWELTRSQASVGLWRYFVNSSSEATYDISAFDVNSKYVDVIWDRVQVQSYSVSDSRDDINDNVNIDATLWYDHDDSLVVDGTVTINGFSASHQGSGVWRITRTSSTVTSVTYNTVAASGNTHGITAVDQNSQSQEVIWDRVLFTLNVNMTWTVIGYYVNVSWVSIYDFDDTPYLGTEIVYNDGGVLTYTTVGNRTFYVTSMDDSAGYSLTEFTTNTVWCVWDDVVPSGGVGYSWMQYSATQVYLVWGVGSNWKWDFNDTLLEVNVVFHAYSNSSSPESSGGTYGSGAFGGLTVGPYTPSWHYVNLVVKCEVTIDSIAYDWSIWEDTLEVDILHTIHIEDSGMDVQDTWLTFYFHTNWNNATFYVWNNDSLLGGSLEGWYQVAKPTTAGLHNFTILINGTQGSIITGEQTKDFSVNDAWVWRNFKYSVSAPDADAELSLVAWDVDRGDYYWYITWATNWGNSSITPYEDGSPASGTTENYTLQYLKSTSVDNHTLDFKIYSGASVIWKNYSYSITVTEAYSWQYITIKNQAGDYIDIHNFNVFVNSTEIFVDRFYDRTTGYVFNITITDLFGDLLHMDNHSFSYSYEITLNVHSFQLVSELFEPIWIRLTSSGGGYKEVWLYREEPYEWWLYENVTYQWFWDIDQAGMGQPTGPHYYPTDGSWYSPTSALMYLMTGYGMAELKDDIPDSQGGGGGGLTDADKENITEAVIEDIKALFDPLQGGSVGLMIVTGFGFLSYLQYTVVQATRKPKKKKTPEEIEELEEQKRKKLKSRLKPKKLKSTHRPKKLRGGE